MKERQTWFKYGGAIGISIAISAGFLQPTSAQAQQKIRLGVTLPLSGVQAGYANQQAQGARMAVDDINKAGGFNGKLVEAVIEDTNSSAQGGIAAFNKLVKADRVDAVVTLSSPVVAALVPLSERNKVVILDTATISAGIWNATPNRKYSFTIYPKSDFEAAQTAKYFLAKGYKNVAVMATGTETGQGPAKAFIADFTKAGGNIVAQEYYPASTTDFASYLNKLAQSSPQMVNLICNEECGLIVRQAVENGLKFKWFGASPMVGQRFVDLAGPAAEGALATTAGWNPNSKDPKTVDFIARYTESFKEAPTVFSAYIYDGVHILAKAVAEGGSDPDKIANALRGSTFLGVTGETKIESNGMASKPININEVKDGKFVVVETLASK